MSKAAQDSCCQRRIDLPALPARSLAFLGQNLLVAGGWGCKVYLFEQELGGLRWHQRSWKAGDHAQEPWVSAMIAVYHACMHAWRERRLRCMQGAGTRLFLVLHISGLSASYRLFGRQGVANFK